MIKDIDNTLKQIIDTLRYAEKPAKQKKVSNKITIGWEHVLPEPPDNTSDFTKNELLFMSELTDNLNSNQIDLVKLVDDDPNHLFEPIISKYNLSSHKSQFKRAWSLAEPIIMNLKWKWNRPRPYQLTSFYNIPIKVIESDTHHTPSYPSGHTAWAAMMGYILAQHYPEYSSEIFGKISLAGEARVLQGVHFPSDNDASMVITGAIWEDIRHEIMEN